MTEETKVKMKDYGVKALPTTVIEGKSKVADWICGGDLFKKLKKRISLKTI